MSYKTTEKNRYYFLRSKLKQAELSFSEAVISCTKLNLKGNPNEISRIFKAGDYLTDRQLKTINERDRRDLQAVEEIRPRTRQDCLPGGRNECRPCIFFSCPHHLTVETTGFTSVRKGLAFNEDDFISRLIGTEEDYLKIKPSLAFDANGKPRENVKLFKYQCDLDATDEHEEGMILEDVGDCLGVTRERARQLEDWKNFNPQRARGGAIQTIRRKCQNLLSEFSDLPVGSLSPGWNES